MITKSFVWLETRLDTGGWVRRIYLLIATLMLWRITEWAMAFAEASKLPGTDIGIIIGAVSVPASAVSKFAFDAYLESRKP
jgi:hypothetical protein